MCNKHSTVSFDDLEDKEFWDSEPAPAKPSTSPHVEDISNVEIPGFVEDCPKCRGTGNWRPGYKCFKCKGKGKLQFKTSPEARGKARASAQKRKAKNKSENIAAFKAAFPVEAAWLISNSDGNTFADSLRESVEKYGHLTEKQLAAVRNAIARDADAANGVQEWADNNEAEYNWLKTEDKNGNEFAGSLLSALKRYGSLTEGQLNAVRNNVEKVKDIVQTNLDISSLKGYYAVPNGDTRLKICVRKPGKNSRYHGWTFVDDGAAYGSRQSYGKQAPEGMYQGKLEEQLKAILANPLEAQKAYGHLTGVCGRCGRILEDEQSVAAGIGPICATKV